MTIIQYCASSCNISIVIQSLYSLASYSDFICSRSHHRKQCRLHGIATSSILLFEISRHVGVGSEGIDGIHIAVGCTTGPLRLWNRVEARLSDGAAVTLRTVGVVVLLLLSIAFLVGDSYNPFLYFRF